MGVIKKIGHVRNVGTRKTVKKESSKLKSNANTKLKLRKRGRRPKRKSCKQRAASKGTPELINQEQAVDAVQALLLLIEKTANESSQLFGDESQPILMQIAAVRVPKVPYRRLRFKLPHPLITDTTDVCLFVRNVKSKSRKLKMFLESKKKLFRMMSNDRMRRYHKKLSYYRKIKDFEKLEACRKNNDDYRKKIDEYRKKKEMKEAKKKFVIGESVQERTLAYYQRRFKEQGISQISEVLTPKHLKTEYKQYEEIRRLYQRFDVFLSDVRISDRVAHHFGKCFKFSLKTPIPIRVTAVNLKEEVDKALSRTTMHIHGKGDSYIVQVGHTKQPVKDIVENILSVSTGLAKGFPGGWDNVSALYIKSTKSMSVPVYVSMKSPNDIPVPFERPLRPKNAAPVEGDLSTVIGYNVKLYASGRLKLQKVKEDYDYEWSDEEYMLNFDNKVRPKKERYNNYLEDEKKFKKKSGKKASQMETKNNVKVEDKVEADIEGAEESYMQQWERKKDDEFKEKVEKQKGGVSVQPRKNSNRVKYVVGEMCLGSIGNPIKKVKKSSSGGMAHTAFQELKSKINKKKHTKKQNVPKNKIKSVTCSSKRSKSQKKNKMKGKKKGTSS